MNVEGQMLLEPMHVVPETYIFKYEYVEIDILAQKQDSLKFDGYGKGTCQASYAGLRTKTGLTMCFTTSRGKKHWNTVQVTVLEYHTFSDGNQ